MGQPVKQRGSALLLEVLRDPKVAVTLDDVQWNDLVRLGRVSDLLANLHSRLDQLGLLSSIPEKPLIHMESAVTMTTKHEHTIDWELVQISDALSQLDCQIIVLKGAAYQLQQLNASKGRVFHDVDIMVPKSAISDAEAALKDSGWISAKQDAYDQRYYRDWMHELPPMNHFARRVTIDVHHTIIPPTVALKPDAAKLFDSAVPVVGHPRLFTLSPVDMVLHSATHLFYDDEIGRGMRDLVDLHHLLTEFSAEPGFWVELLDRSTEMDLDYPLACALKYSRLLLETDIPDGVYSRAQKQLRFPSWMMDKLFIQGLMPEHELCDTWRSGIARFVLYVRSHYLRMPMYLLIPHLIRKAFREDAVVEVENPKPLG